TIRFKKGSKNPIKQETHLKGNEIIENTNLTRGDFLNRWQRIKYKDYNLLTFNCRSLLNANT
ncbi:unnamed protein product, partial [marine sediment metagenome]